MTVTPDAVSAADGQARAAARLRGATEALDALGHRSPADQQHASLFAMNLLRTEVAFADWSKAGLPGPPPAGPAAGVGQSARPRLPVEHRAVVLLARAAMDLHAAGLRISERPGHWERLLAFFADRLSETAPELLGLRERALTARADAREANRIFALPTPAITPGSAVPPGPPPRPQPLAWLIFYGPVLSTPNCAGRRRAPG